MIVPIPPVKNFAVFPFVLGFYFWSRHGKISDVCTARRWFSRRRRRSSARRQRHCCDDHSGLRRDSAVSILLVSNAVVSSTIRRQLDGRSTAYQRSLRSRWRNTGRWPASRSHTDRFIFSGLSTAAHAQVGLRSSRMLNSRSAVESKSIRKYSCNRGALRVT